MGNIFDILGPVMVGPSSSHTAGAVRIGMVARQLFGRQPERAEVYFTWFFCCNRKGAWNGPGADRRIIGDDAGRYADTGQLRSCKRHGDGFCNEE